MRTLKNLTAIHKSCDPGGFLAGEVFVGLSKQKVPLRHGGT